MKGSKDTKLEVKSTRQGGSATAAEVGRRRNLYRCLRRVSAAVTLMLMFSVIEIFAQGTGRGNPAQVGAIVGWILRLGYAILGVIGAFKIVGGWGMMGDGQQGWQRKMTGGLGYMASSFLVGIGVELSQGNLPDLGLEGVLGY